MMRFGLKITADNMLTLIDMDTAEILAEGPGCADWLNAYDGNCTYTLVEQSEKRGLTTSTLQCIIKIQRTKERKSR